MLCSLMETKNDRILHVHDSRHDNAIHVCLLCPIDLHWSTSEICHFIRPSKCIFIIQLLLQCGSFSSIRPNVLLSTSISFHSLSGLVNFNIIHGMGNSLFLYRVAYSVCSNMFSLVVCLFLSTLWTRCFETHLQMDNWKKIATSHLRREDINCKSNTCMMSRHSSPKTNDRNNYASKFRWFLAPSATLSHLLTSEALLSNVLLFFYSCTFQR